MLIQGSCEVIYKNRNFKVGCAGLGMHRTLTLFYQGTQFYRVRDSILLYLKFPADS